MRFGGFVHSRTNTSFAHFRKGIAVSHSIEFLNHDEEREALLEKFRPFLDEVRQDIYDLLTMDGRLYLLLQQSITEDAVTFPKVKITETTRYKKGGRGITFIFNNEFGGVMVLAGSTVSNNVHISYHYCWSQTLDRVRRALHQGDSNGFVIKFGYDEHPHVIDASIPLP